MVPAGHPRLEHFQEKHALADAGVEPVFGPKMRQRKNARAVSSHVKPALVRSVKAPEASDGCAPHLVAHWLRCDLNQATDFRVNGWYSFCVKASLRALQIEA
jgi:hypothetical protein